MSEQIIRLQRAEWRYDTAAALGRRGGFGAVYEGHSASGAPVAVKKLHITSEAAGHREMEMAAALSVRSLRNVMPVLDWGADADGGGYFLVMPRAEGSLQGRLNRAHLSEDETVIALLDIARGLAEVRDIIHRDLKPDNVLRHDGRWVVADFGIAKFVEDSTSLRTLRDCLTAHYAAPEQWRLETPTNATDVYALGCIGIALLTGRPPFHGREDIQHCHLHVTPPAAPAAPALRQLIATCLRKPPGARPSLPSVIEQLERAQSTVLRHDPIVAAGAVVAERAAASDAHAAHERSREQARADLAKAGDEILVELRQRIFDEIKASSPLAQQIRDSGIALGEGVLTIEKRFQVLPTGTFKSSGWDVITGWIVKVTQSNNRRYRERSANLWYADRDNSGSYRWFEVGYWTWGGRQVTNDAPFALNSSQLTDADLALSNITHTFDVSPRPPRPIDGTGEDWFVERWKRWLAEAATSSMSYPSHMPER